MTVQGIIGRSFSTEIGGTLKLRRSRVSEKFHAQLDEMYSGH